MTTICEPMPSDSYLPSLVLLADRCDDLMATSSDFDCNATFFEGSVSLVLDVESEAFFHKIIDQTYSAILDIQPLSEDYKLTYLFSEDNIPLLSVLHQNDSSVSSSEYDDQTYDGIFGTILFVVLVSGSILAIATCMNSVFRPRSGCWRELSCSDDEESQMNWKPPVPRTIIVEHIEASSDEIVDAYCAAIPSI